LTSKRNHDVDFILRVMGGEVLGMGLGSLYAERLSPLFLAAFFSVPDSFFLASCVS
jgi:hypothetical protein